MPTADLMQGIADDLREIKGGMADLREDFKVRMALSERDRAELRSEINILKAKVEALTLAPGNVALSWAERVALGVTSLLLTGVGALVGSQLGGTHK
jgi:3-dehydroquinate synthase class II